MFKKVGIMATVGICALALVNSVSAATQDGWYKNGENWELYQNNQLTRNQWAKDQDKWYHFDENGSMQTGWLKENNHWYYLDKTGAMQSGWSKAVYDGKEDWYYFDKSGAMQTGWIKDETNRWYSLRPDGTMRTGWYKDGDTWYYLGSYGDMKTGWYKIKDQVGSQMALWSYFTASGAMVSDTTVPAADGNEYVIGVDGYLLMNTPHVRLAEVVHKGDVDYLYRSTREGVIIAKNEWFLPNNATLEVPTYGFDLLKEVADHQEKGNEINPNKVVKNLQQYYNRFYFGSDGKRVLPLPEMTIHSSVVLRDGKPFIEHNSPRLDVLSIYTIVENELYLLKNLYTGELYTEGYRYFPGESAFSGYDLLIRTDKYGKILYMKRLEDGQYGQTISAYNGEKVLISFEKNPERGATVVE